MPTLTLRNLGYPSNSPAGSIAPSGIEVRAGVGPGPQGPVGIGLSGPPGPTGPGGATGMTGSGAADLNIGATGQPASPGPGAIWTTIDGDMFVWAGPPQSVWVQVG